MEKGGTPLPAKGGGGVAKKGEPEKESIIEINKKKKQESTCLCLCLCFWRVGVISHRALQPLFKISYRLWVAFEQCTLCQIHQKKFRGQTHPFFLAVQNSSIGDLVTDSLTHWVRDLLKNTTTGWPKRLVTLETFDQGDEETWPHQKKDNDKDKDKYKDNDKDN